MNKFFIVLSHTYLTRLKSKAFIITTAILLLLIIAIANLDSIIKIFQSDDEVTEVIVMTDSDDLFNRVNIGLETMESDIVLKKYDKSLEKGKDAIEKLDYNALLVLAEDEKGLPQPTYYANSIAGDDVLIKLEVTLQLIKESILIDQVGIDEKMLNEINSPIYIEKIALDKSAKTDEELDQARGIVYVMIFILYMAVLIYGQMIATDVATEKSSRVMEILISSASPVTHMFAKIIGIALLGITQTGIVAIFGYSLLKSNSLELLETFGFNDTHPILYLYGILFFILGYFLYATIAAMFGSLVSRVEDLQQLLMPMIMLIMIAFFIAMFGLTMPESKLITVTSFIPFFAPMIMFLRVGMLEVPIWEVLTSISILIGTIIILGVIGARIYRGGVLMYGPSRSLKDIRNAFKLSKKE